jgi:cytoskeletal protein CcmA (bactofilin family)
MAYIGVSPQNGVRKKHTYTASGSQTDFTGAGAEGITLSYKDSNFVDVYQNGVKLAEADYTSTSGTTIVLAQGAAANDIVEIIVYDVFSTSDMVSASDGGTFAGNVAMSGTLTLTGNGDFNGDLDVDGTLETDALTINGVTLAETISDTVGAMVSGNTETGITVTYDDSDNTLDFVVGTLNQDTTGTAANATLAATVTVTDSTANTNFPIVFHDESNALLDDTGALRYNPSTGELLVPKLTVAGTTTTVDTVTMNAANAVVFEGATADAHETTLTIVDPTADRTINLPNVSGTIPVLAAASNTAITSTPAELNLLDGITAGTVSASLAVIVDSNKDITGFRNVTLTGELDAGSLDISGDIDVDGTTNLDVVDIDGAVDMASTLAIAGVATVNRVINATNSADPWLKGVNSSGTETFFVKPDGSASFSGAVTANAGVVVDNITIDGTEIDLSSGDLTIDVAGDIILDADGGDISFRDDGTGFLAITNSSNDAVIHSVQNDKDMIFTGTDNGSTVTALTLDMSDAGTATFNHDILLGDNNVIKLGASADLQINHNSSSGNSFIKDVGAGMLILGSDGTGILLQKTSGETMGQFLTDGAVELYHDNSKKIETTSSGVTVTGSITSTNNMTMGADTQIQISGDGGSSGLQLLGQDSSASLVGTLGSQNLLFRIASAERLRLTTTGRLENQSPSNTGNVLQDFRIDFRNENNAGVMAGIGCVRTGNANAPGAFVIRTSTNVDSSSNSGDGEISEKFRVAANGDLTATDTSIASNSDSRLKENISDFAYDLDKFKSLKTKTFDWKNPKLHGEKSGQRGFIAQDIETVDNYWIEEIEVSADSDDFQYLEDKDILYTENSTIPVYEEGDTIPDGKKVGDAKYSVGDLEYKARFAKTSKLGQKDAMYVSIIQQLITKIETLEAKVTALESA